MRIIIIVRKSGINYFINFFETKIGCTFHIKLTGGNKIVFGNAFRPLVGALRDNLAVLQRVLVSLPARTRE